MASQCLFSPELEAVVDERLGSSHKSAPETFFLLKDETKEDIPNRNRSTFCQTEKLYKAFPNEHLSEVKRKTLVRQDCT